MSADPARSIRRAMMLAKSVGSDVERDVSVANGGIVAKALKVTTEGMHPGSSIIDTAPASEAMEIPTPEQGASYIRPQNSMPSPASTTDDEPSVRSYHGTWGQFTTPDFNRLGEVTRDNATGSSNEKWAMNLARAGFWTSVKPLETAGYTHSIPFRLTGKMAAYGSLDKLERAIRNAGGPEKFREGMISKGYRHAKVKDEEFNGTSYVSFDPKSVVHDAAIAKSDGGTVDKALRISRKHFAIGGYDNTLDQVLGTNNPTMNQIFGATYPTPPATVQPTPFKKPAPVPAPAAAPQAKPIVPPSSASPLNHGFGPSPTPFAGTSSPSSRHDQSEHGHLSFRGHFDSADRDYIAISRSIGCTAELYADSRCQRNRASAYARFGHAAQRVSGRSDAIRRISSIRGRRAQCTKPECCHSSRSDDNTLRFPAGHIVSRKRCGSNHARLSELCPGRPFCGARGQCDRAWNWPAGFRSDPSGWNSIACAGRRNAFVRIYPSAGNTRSSAICGQHRRAASRDVSDTGCDHQSRD